MANWILSSNDSVFRIGDALQANGNLVDWRKQNHIHKGDTIFMYKSAPEKRIRYRFEVIKSDFGTDEAFDQQRFWTNQEQYYSGLESRRFIRLKLIEEYKSDELSLSTLREHGLRSNLQGGQKINGPLLDYLISYCSLNNHDEIDYPEHNSYFEGAITKIVANRYERDQGAREACIHAKGCTCAVCGFNFAETYGVIGSDFIHVHHIVPISTIGQEYQIDPILDLVPVCPNCHYMIHRRTPPYSIDELKSLIKSNAQ